MSVIDLGSKREVFWDNYLVDEAKTTAFSRMIEPKLVGPCFWFDKGRELDSVSYPNLVKDDKGYKLYYYVWGWGDNHPAYLAVIESEDGKNWTRPALDIYDQPELEINNVCMKGVETPFVFYDTNPNCLKEEKYKMLAPKTDEIEPGKKAWGLWAYVSEDGYHFNKSHLITTDGHFDSLNTAHYHDGEYVCYYRHMHTDECEELIKWDNKAKRDIRVIRSKDFRIWTKQKRISFEDGLDYALYTNNVICDERAPHIKIGFPTRYCERDNWTQNTEQMVSSKLKKHIIETTEKRSGLALTDAIFMHSREGENWHRFNEAYFTPGYESEHNWVYGDCYPAYGFVDSGREVYYMYTKDWHRSVGSPKPLNLYEVRKDGFACYMADGKERVIVTKPLVFKGKDLHINFQTSAYGYIYVDVLDKDGHKLSENESFEIYGDNIDRRILFSDGSDFSKYEGKPIRLRFIMRDAKLYSLKFD